MSFVQLSDVQSTHSLLPEIDIDACANSSVGVWGRWGEGGGKGVSASSGDTPLLVMIQDSSAPHVGHQNCLEWVSCEQIPSAKYMQSSDYIFFKHGKHLGIKKI